MDDQFCPRCKTTKYRNPSLKLLVNVCGHALCENCVERLFVRGSGSCPQCDVPLRRNNFRAQLFEDTAVEKDTDIRKKILKEFNKGQDEFSSLREYNDYLEMVETLVFNLTNGIEVEETKEKIEQYRRENKDSIKKNTRKLNQEMKVLEDLIEQEKNDKDKARDLHLKEEIDVRKEKMKSKQALIDDLIYSDLPADHILAQHEHEATSQQQPKARTVTTFSSGIQMNSHNAFVPVPKIEEVPLFVYTALKLQRDGPEPPDDMQLDPFLKHMRTATVAERGGGYSETIACKRAIEDAFCGLFFAYTNELLKANESDSASMDMS